MEERSLPSSVSTWSLEGYCLSPKLFNLYTHDCVSTQDSSIVISYTDDTTIPGLIKGEDEAGYRTVVNDIMVHGEDSGLILEIIIDFRKKATLLQSLIIKGTEVETVDSHRFCCLELTSYLSWTAHTTSLVKKAQKRLYL